MRIEWIAWFLMGCAHGSTGSAGVEPVQVSESRVVAAPLTPTGTNDWYALEWEDRHSRMTFSVLPNLGRRFREHRDEDSASLACITCHGEDAEARRYAMPASLPALDPDAIPQNAEARWMADVVVPLADRIMRAGGTTTCFTCHPAVGS